MPNKNMARLTLPLHPTSFLEANLFIICGSMPTLRKFFKHFAPQFMGGSSSNPSYANNYGPSGYALGGGHSSLGQSRAARKQRKHYEVFPEENELRTFPSNEGKTSPDIPGKEQSATMTVDVAGGSDPEADNRSDKAILQTKSFTVSYD